MFFLTILYRWKQVKVLFVMKILIHCLWCIEFIVIKFFQQRYALEGVVCKVQFRTLWYVTFVRLDKGIYDLISQKPISSTNLISKQGARQCSSGNSYRRLQTRSGHYRNFSLLAFSWFSGHISMEGK